MGRGVYCNPAFASPRHVDVQHPPQRPAGIAAGALVLHDPSANGCAAEYLPLDVCYFGDCVHLGAVRTGTTGGDTCSWGALLCYGHSLEMGCTATADAQCTCKVDKVELGKCALGKDVEPDVCDDELGTFTGCCTEVFLAALQA